jgi:serine-type D-Ala-D-Ala carboxypeptidase
MHPDFTSAQAIMLDAVPRVAPAAQLVVRWCGKPVLEHSYGWLDPETRLHPVDATTLFDLASVSKLFVATTFMTLVEAGTVALDQPISRVLPELQGQRPIRPYEDPLTPGGLISVAEPTGFVDVGAITFRQVLSHTSGLPAWRPLFRQPSREAAGHMALTTACAYPTGTQVVYSDIGLILLGLAIERLTDRALDQAVAERVTDPLGISRTRYLPVGTDHKLENVAPTELCGWRDRRVTGEVHDENAASLGGVAGHAGIFSTAADVAAFGQVFLDSGRGQRSAIAARGYGRRDDPRTGVAQQSPTWPRLCALVAGSGGEQQPIERGGLWSHRLHWHVALDRPAAIAGGCVADQRCLLRTSGTGNWIAAGHLAPHHCGSNRPDKLKERNAYEAPAWHRCWFRRHRVRDAVFRVDEQIQRMTARRRLPLCNAFPGLSSSQP